MEHQHLILNNPLVSGEEIFVTFIQVPPPAQQKSRGELAFDGENLLGDTQNVNPLTVYVYDNILAKHENLRSCKAIHFYECQDIFQEITREQDRFTNAEQQNKIYDAVIVNSIHTSDEEIYVLYGRIGSGCTSIEQNDAATKPGYWSRFKSGVGSSVGAVTSVLTNRSFWELFAKTAAYGSTAYVNYLYAKHFRSFWDGSAYFLHGMIDFGSRRDWLVGYNSKKYIWYDLAIAGFQSMRGYAKSQNMQQNGQARATLVFKI
jgi:hypothetical protein